MYIILSILLISVLIAILVYYYHSYNLVSALSGTKYRVASEYKDQVDAANLLDTLNSRAKKLISYLQETQPNASYTQNLENRYRSNIVENRQGNLANTSYVIDKGEKIAMCLRINGRLHDINILTFVFIHELAHIAIDAYGHPAEFWQTFKILLDAATAIKIYKPINYSKSPEDYCGLSIYYNPQYSVQ